MKGNTNNRLQTDESIFLRGPLSRFKSIVLYFQGTVPFYHGFSKNALYLAWCKRIWLRRVRSK